MKSVLSGLVAAPFTPFHPDGSLNLGAIPQQSESLVRNGVSGAFICGTTGEGYSLSLDERKHVAAEWRRAAPSTLKLVVHVGHLCLSDSCDLARHAESIGADAIATIAPSFFKPAGATELVEWCAKVARAAPGLPFYYYHMPAMTGVSVAAHQFLELGHTRIPTLAGIKFTDEDLLDYGLASQVADGRYAMLFGRDEILLAGLSLGAAGAVGSTYNYAAPLFLRIIQAFELGNLSEARRYQTRAQEFIAVMVRHGGLAAGKAMMGLIGLECGPVREPLRRLDGTQQQELRRDLERIGFFEYACQIS